ncbi:MAG TPA: hypothetical protein VFV31_09115 [Chitinophagaceae bacterium]|nr:hypothetical protein [Chitinophagaceae bacterium]
MKKRDKELKRRYGKLAEGMEPYYHHLDLRPLSEMDDEAFAFIMEKVKGVNMLDLNETQISNESINYLTRLEYVNELRARGCHNLNDGCIPYLNKLRSLTFLHLKYTGITISGLLQLTGLTNLKELMFSADEEGDITEQMLQLKQQLPGCAFVVNAKPWIFED